MKIKQKVSWILTLLSLLLSVGCSPQAVPISALADIEPVPVPNVATKAIVGNVQFGRAVTRGHWQSEAFSRLRSGEKSQFSNEFGAIEVIQVRPTLKIGYKSYNISTPTEYILEMSNEGTILHASVRKEGVIYPINVSTMSDQNMKMWKFMWGSFDFSRPYGQGDIVSKWNFSEFMGSSNISGIFTAKLVGEAVVGNRRAFVLDFSGAGMMVQSISLVASGYQMIDAETSLVLDSKVRFIARNQKGEVVAISDDSASIKPPMAF